MVKLFHSQHAFAHSWAQVTQAHWQKYPNSMSPQVISVDVLQRSVDPTTGILRTERLITCQQPIPSLFRQIFHTDAMYFYETSMVDPHKQTYQSTSRNLTYSNLLSLEERVAYKVDPQQPLRRTVLEQQAAVDVSTGGIAGVRSYLEEFCITSFKTNAERGRKGLEEVIRNLFSSADSNAKSSSREYGKQHVAA